MQPVRLVIMGLAGVTDNYVVPKAFPLVGRPQRPAATVLFSSLWSVEVEPDSDPAAVLPGRVLTGTSDVSRSHGQPRVFQQSNEC